MNIFANIVGSGGKKEADAIVTAETPAELGHSDEAPDAGHRRRPPPYRPDGGLCRARPRKLQGRDSWHCRPNSSSSDRRRAERPGR